jgi:hypothetical protein
MWFLVLTYGFGVTTTALAHIQSYTILQSLDRLVVPSFVVLHFLLHPAWAAIVALTTVSRACRGKPRSGAFRRALVRRSRSRGPARRAGMLLSARCRSPSARSSAVTRTQHTFNNVRVLL